MEPAVDRFPPQASLHDHASPRRRSDCGTCEEGQEPSSRPRPHVTQQFDDSRDLHFTEQRLWTERPKRPAICVPRSCHVCGHEGLRRLLQRHLRYRTLEEAALPIHVVASELVSGDEVLLSARPAVDAVLASAAIPGVFPPVEIAGRLLVDGGVANNTPISSAIRLGATRFFVLPTGFACALRQVPSNAIARAMHAPDLLVVRQLLNDIERYRHAVELHVVPSLCPLDTSPYDYSAAASLIDRATETTQTRLAGGGLARGDVPMQFHVHTH